MMYAPPGAQQATQTAPPLDLSGRQPEIAERVIDPDQEVLGSRTPLQHPRNSGYDASPAGTMGFSPMPGNMAQKMQQHGPYTAEKVCWGCCVAQS